MTETKTLTALEFANARDNVVVRWAGNGCPGGCDTAWVPPETDLPFDLADVAGEVGDDGEFTATNLKSGPGVWDWRFHDWNGNLIYAIWLRVDPVEWGREYAEAYGEDE
jgi:hypothetical protein